MNESEKIDEKAKELVAHLKGFTIIEAKEILKRAIMHLDLSKVT